MTVSLVVFKLHRVSVNAINCPKSKIGTGSAWWLICVLQIADAFRTNQTKPEKTRSLCIRDLEHFTPVARFQRNGKVYENNN